MSETDWTMIPGRLRSKGFAFHFERIFYDPERPLWSARACRGGREWSAIAENLRRAILELERQTQEPGEDWRKTLATITAREQPRSPLVK